MQREPRDRHIAAAARVSLGHAGQRGARERMIAELTPVRRLFPPPVRALGWLALMLAIAATLGTIAERGVADRLMAVPDLWLATLGSAATALLAAVAAFELCLPDRSRCWALAPMPGLAVWIGASGLGCSQSWLLPNLGDAAMTDGPVCVLIVIGLSVPLSLIMMSALRRGYSFTPRLAGAIAGLAVAAAAATLLNVVHPLSSAIEETLIYAVAVIAVVAANWVAAARLLAGRPPSRFR